MKAGMIGDVEFKKAGSETVCCVSLINTTHSDTRRFNINP